MDSTSHQKDPASRQDLIYGGLSIFWFLLMGLWFGLAWEKTLSAPKDPGQSHVSKRFQAVSYSELSVTPDILEDELEPNIHHRANEEKTEIEMQLPIDPISAIDETQKEEIIREVLARLSERTNLMAAQKVVNPDPIQNPSSLKFESAKPEPTLLAQRPETPEAPIPAKEVQTQDVINAKLSKSKPRALNPKENSTPLVATEPLNEKQGLESWQLKLANAKLARKQKDFAGAQTFLDEIKKTDLKPPEIAELQLEKAKIDFDRGLYLQALPSFVVARRDKDLEYSASYYLGASHFHLENYGKAQNIFRNILETKPQDSQTHHFLGTTLLKANQAKQAENHFLKAIELGKSDSKLFYQTSLAQEVLGKKREALGSLKKALEKDPNYIDAQKKLMQLEASLIPTKNKEVIDDAGN